MKAPFPWFGGKSRAAQQVWAALGDVDCYVEPFGGSLALLLARPETHRRKVETVNDADGLLINWWRAVAADPDLVATWADWPVSEADLTARHLWLVERRADITTRLHADPAWYDAQAAGWWVWGACSWIGSGWCSGEGPWRVVDGSLIDGNSGMGIHRQLPHLGNSGRGIHRQLPHLGDAGRGGDRRLVLRPRSPPAPCPGVVRRLGPCADAVGGGAPRNGRGGARPALPGGVGRRCRVRGADRVRLGHLRGRVRRGGGPRRPGRPGGGLRVRRDLDPAPGLDGAPVDRPQGLREGHRAPPGDAVVLARVPARGAAGAVRGGVAMTPALRHQYATALRTLGLRDVADELERPTSSLRRSTSRSAARARLFHASTRASSASIGRYLPKGEA